MISSVKELKYLRELDTGERLDPRDKIRATAARVGLAVPQVCIPDFTMIDVLFIISSFIMNS
jgi:hypothetical protein